MNKWYLISVITVMVLGLTTAIYFGLQGKTVPLIKWSHFSNSQEVAGAVQKRMRQELQPFQIYFIGPHPQKNLHIDSVIELAQWIRSQGPNLLITDTLLTEREPKIQALKPDLVLDLVKDRDRFLSGINAIEKGRKIIVIAPNIYVTHYLSQSAINQMQEELKSKNYIVLSFVNFPASREDEKNFEFPCQTLESTTTQLDFGCFILGQSRKFYVKNKIAGKTPGFLNLVRSREYMFFLGH